MVTTMREAEIDGSEMGGRFWERRALRAHIINNESELRGRAAPAAVAGLRELYESDEAQALAAPPSADEVLVLVDRVIRFVEVGLEGATDRPAKTCGALGVR
jgi:hypothetical protein